MNNLTNIGFKIMKIGRAERVEIDFFEFCPDTYFALIFVSSFSNFNISTTIRHFIIK